jgi:hypothetical protein
MLSGSFVRAEHLETRHFVVERRLLSWGLLLWCAPSPITSQTVWRDTWDVQLDSV